jgi:hypothetical protein
VNCGVTDIVSGEGNLTLNPLDTGCGADQDYERAKKVALSALAVGDEVCDSHSGQDSPWDAEHHG